jgi:hypothetical protein
VSNTQKVLIRTPEFPSDFRALFRAIARCAVTSSFVAGCGGTHAPNEPNPMGGGDGMPHAGTSAHDPSAQQDSSVPNDASLPIDARVQNHDASTGRDDAGSTPAMDASVTLPGPWVPLACGSADQWPFDDTHFATPVEYMALYRLQLTDAQEIALATGGFVGALSYSRRVLHGTPCSGASDETACSSAIEASLAESDCVENPCDDFFLVTHGDTVTRVEERAALSALLGTIDTETEAAIAALFADAWVTCWSELGDGGTDATAGTRVRAIEGGYEIDTRSSCYGSPLIGTATVDGDANVDITADMSFCLGRRPEGLSPTSSVRARHELGAYFTRAARLEAASVYAFEQLARDLERLSAPRALVELALRSALEEVGHTRTMGALAQRFGGEPSAPVVVPQPERSAFAIALDNAVEGCVRETYGALVAFYQAEAATDAHVRAAMLQLAEDETRHAQLAWQVAQWLEPQLCATERDAIVRARRAAYDELQRELGSKLSHAARTLLGLPDETVALALLLQLDAALSLRS